MKENTNKLRCYYNLHKHCLSVQHMTPKGWRVKEHVKEIYLKNVTFKVYEAGRQRVLKEKRKGVHAYVIGEEYGSIKMKGYTKIRYNPYLCGYFYDDDLNPVTVASYCHINNKTILC